MKSGLALFPGSISERSSEVNQGLNKGDYIQMAIDELNKNNNRSFRKSFKAETPDELHDEIDFDKMKVECICPKCGNKHMMNFHWIGRGTPRKFCPPCKGSKE
jgi:hypothetical protein